MLKASLSRAPTIVKPWKITYKIIPWSLNMTLMISHCREAPSIQSIPGCWDNVIIYRSSTESETVLLTGNSPGRAGSPRSWPGSDSPAGWPTCAGRASAARWRGSSSHCGHRPLLRPWWRTCRPRLVPRFSGTCHTVDPVCNMTNIIIILILNSSHFHKKVTLYWINQPKPL